MAYTTKREQIYKEWKNIKAEHGQIDGVYYFTTLEILNIVKRMALVYGVNPKTVQDVTNNMVDVGEIVIDENWTARLRKPKTTQPDSQLKEAEDIDAILLAKPEVK